MDFAVQCSANFQGNCLRIAQNCVSGLFRCQNALRNSIKEPISELLRDLDLVPNLGAWERGLVLAGLSWRLLQSADEGTVVLS